MGEIVSLDARRPHVSGGARCLNCRHEWVAVARTGDDWLECPECFLARGRMVYGCYPSSGSLFTCNCGNDVFYRTLDGLFCLNCGVTHDS